MLKKIYCISLFTMAFFTFCMEQSNALVKADRDKIWSEHFEFKESKQSWHARAKYVTSRFFNPRLSKEEIALRFVELKKQRTAASQEEYAIDRQKAYGRIDAEKEFLKSELAHLALRPKILIVSAIVGSGLLLGRLLAKHR